MIKDLDLQNISDFDVQALIDNELSPQRRIQVLEMLNGNIALKKRYQSLLEQRDLLKFWWDSKEKK